RLLSYEEVTVAKRFDLETLLDKARRILRSFPGPIDAIVGYWDFPTVLMMPILRREFGLGGPSLESVLRCEHKYWARLLQAEVVPDEVPGFAVVDPFDPGTVNSINLTYPFWLKPIKAHSSILGFRISSRSDLEHALAETRRGIQRFSEPMDVIMGYADLPEGIRAIDGSKCIAEEIISDGRQCTLEGYAFEGELEVYGIVDSIRGPNRSSLERYEYPSSLPRHAQERMIASAKAVIQHAGLDDTPFNMEFFFHQRRNAISLLEVNARISKSHSPIFDKVEGVPHKEVMLDVALGRRPDYPARRGRFRYAAKFMPRLYGRHDGWHVRNVPGEDRRQEIERMFPGSEIQMHVHDGMRLGDVHHRDPYSYELAAIFMGAQSRRGLRRDFAALWDAVGLTFEKDA
ncbi:MAG: ATP-grasp domain-containing protein, partial [Planctomycetes bacterium]|nr:ATP-grasp domain-containing protein [Planctomycetota bacterium]